MLLTDTHCKLVEDSFDAVLVNSEAITAHFYKRLFEIAPETKPLFDETNMLKQGRKFISMLGTIVAGLKYPDLIAPPLKALGARHVKYQVPEEYYEIVGQALIWALTEELGDDFTEKTRAAWIIVYDLIVDIVIEGVHEVQMTKQT